MDKVRYNFDFHQKYTPIDFNIPFIKFLFILLFCRENSVEECGLELYFSVDFEILGQINSHELVPNGGDKRIDDSNKDEYLKLMTDWRFSRGKINE